MPKALGIEEIEALVVVRDRSHALRAILNFLRAQNRSARSLFITLEWFRRLGEVDRSLRLLSQESARLLQSDHSHRYYFWLARTLNSVGATSFASSLLQKIRPENSQEWQILGDLYLSNSDHTLALPCYENALRFEKDSRSVIIQILAMSDCFAGMGDFERAIELAKRCLAKGETGYLEGVVHSAIGEYLARFGEFHSAVTSLDLSEALMPKADDSPDRAILLKWRGYALAKTGKVTEGANSILKSIEIFRKFKLRDEAWVLSTLLLNEVQPIGDLRVEQLIRWPGMKQSGPRSIEGARDPKTIVIGGGEQVFMRIWLDSNESEKMGVKTLGLTRELTLLGWVAWTEASGLSVYRAAALLWPDRPHEVPLLLKRIQQLAHRLRTEHSIQLDQVEGRLFLAEDQRDSVAVLRGNSLPTFLAQKMELKQPFTARDLRAFYGMASPTQSSQILKQWLLHKLIIQRGFRYIANLENNVVQA